MGTSLLIALLAGSALLGSASAAPSIKRTNVITTQGSPFNLHAQNPDYDSDNFNLCIIGSDDYAFATDYCVVDGGVIPADDRQFELALGTLIGYLNGTATNDTSKTFVSSNDLFNYPANGSMVTFRNVEDPAGGTKGYGIDQETGSFVRYNQETGEIGNDWFICPPLYGERYGRTLVYGFQNGTDLQNQDCFRYNITVI